MGAQGPLVRINLLHPVQTGSCAPAGWRRSCFRPSVRIWAAWNWCPAPGACSRSRSMANRSGNASATAAFPEAKVLKRLVRDRVWPDRDLGHSDR